MKYVLVIIAYATSTGMTTLDHPASGQRYTLEDCQLMGNMIRKQSKAQVKLRYACLAVVK